MHDPLVVAFEIRRPWPKRTNRSHNRRRWSKFSCGFITLAGHDFYFPGIITIWHVEPNGHDSGEVCSHWRINRDGKRVYTQRWRYHVHHWRIQVSPLQQLRRRLLTRCAWCGGKHRRTDPVNNARGWEPPREKRWWKGETHLFHRDCIAIHSAHISCTCNAPVLDHGDYGRCADCDGFRAWNTPPERLEHYLELKQIPTGGRLPEAGGAQ